MIEQGDHIVLGLSGGPDSMCLFHVLRTVFKEQEIGLTAVHVNHKFRPGAAEEEQEYVEKLCKKAGVDCRSFVFDCSKIAEESHMTGEEAGRKVRYDSFFEVTKELRKKGVPAKKIKTAVAHNMNDQAETVLFRILRGTGTDGLSGMEYKRKDEKGMTVIRPLLDVKRTDIDEYCRSNKLDPRKDKSNEEPLYARNKIRLDLIPYIEENYNPNIKDALIRLCGIAYEDSSFINTEAEKVLKKALVSNKKEKCVIDIREIKDLHSAVIGRVIIKAMGMAGLSSDLTNAHIKQAEELIIKGETSKSTNFPHGYIMKTVYGKAEIYRQEVVETATGTELEMQAEAADGTKLTNKPGLKISILMKEDFTGKKDVAIFDFDMFEEAYKDNEKTFESIVLRTRKPGDFIVLPDVGGRKKIQDLFVDTKVREEKRENVYMVAINSEILWIPAGITKARYSGNFKVNEDTKRVLVLEIHGSL
ncbi:MAG TPA: tRNA lysidine(34) synthetase TilS [Bacillota bacterium]|nr:tRNA lysidine(34) synthetase TilS [Bacillota bacterium]